MNIEQKLAFLRAFKRLKDKERKLVEAAIGIIIDNPDIGEAKRGDLAGFRVYKFRLNKQLMLIAYCYKSEKDILCLEALGTHENFYRDLKNR